MDEPSSRPMLDRRRLLKLGAASLVVALVPGQLLRAQSLPQSCAIGPAFYSNPIGLAGLTGARN